MEGFWSLVFGAVAALSLILFLGFTLLLVHMTPINRKKFVFGLAVLCVMASCVSTIASSYHVGQTHGTTGHCPEEDWLRKIFTSFKGNEYPGYPGWITITPVVSHSGTFVLISYELTKRQRIGTRFIIIWTTYICLLLTMGFHGLAVYMLIFCSKVYSLLGSTICTSLTSFYTALFLHFKFFPPMPLPVVQHSPGQMLSAQLMDLEEDSTRLTASQEASDAKEERPGSYT